jgi:hypothetical protein
VVIGVDPHKLSVTIGARDNREILRAAGRFGTDARSYHQLLEAARQWPERVWAVEGANGIGRPLMQRLLASGERVAMCRPGSPPAPGSSTPARAARPTPPTRTPLSWLDCGIRDYERSAPVRS